MFLKLFSTAVLSLYILNSHAAEAVAKLDLNKADIKSLTHSVKGIGKGRAQKIIQYREAHHGFKSIEQLAEVSGIGQSFVASHMNELKAKFTISQ